MKQLIPFGFVSTLLLSTNAFSVNPSQGFYVGLLGEGSSGPSSYTTVFEEDGYFFEGRVNNSRIGGGGGAMLGYRYNQFRLEAEFLYNWNGSGTVNVGECTLQSPTVLTPTGFCSNLDNFEGNKLGFNGSIATLYGMANLLYDFVDYDTESNYFPYVGLGIGHASVESRGNFVRTVTPAATPPSHGQKASYSSGAAQGIIGLGLFMDDFTWAGVDYRYLTTNTIRGLNNQRYAINTVNVNVNLSFDKGSN